MEVLELQIDRVSVPKYYATEDSDFSRNSGRVRFLENWGEEASAVLLINKSIGKNNNHEKFGRILLRLYATYRKEEEVRIRSYNLCRRLWGTF